jgi:putative ABC transport system permease protein
MLTDVLYRLRALLRRKSVESEMDDELRAHLEQQVEKYVRSGLPREEAARRARLEFGGLDQVKEECRDARGVNIIETTIRDLRYGLRQLFHNPGFTAVAILTLALGMGANTAIFSLVDEVSFRPRPVPHADRVVRIYTSNPSSEGEIARGRSSYSDFYYIGQGARALSGVAFTQGRGGMLDTGTESKLVSVAMVSDNFFDVLAPTPAFGHIFTAAQAGSPGALTVMLSYPFWSSQFNADRSLPGKTIVFDRRPVTVAGILPRGFRGTEPLVTPDVWVPLSTWSQLVGERPTLETPQRDYELFGRLQPGATLRQANAELAVIAARLEREHPKTNAGRKMMLLPESQVQGEGVRHFTLILLAISGLVLLIACANVASLLIARAEHRRHELAMRRALGASRRRLLRQLLTEAALLGAAATTAALLIGAWVDAVLPKLLPELGFTTPIDAHMTSRVLWFSIGAGLLSVFVFGGIPGWQGTDNSPAEVLKQHGRGATSRALLRSALVVAQVAVSMVLVAGAGLLVRSLVNAESADPGFDAHQNMIVMELAPSFSAKTDEASRAYAEEARRRIEAIPGVLGTAVGLRIPFGLSGSGATRRVFFAGATGSAATEGIPVLCDPVSDNFFEIMGTRVLRGRSINAHDFQTGARVMVINQTLAQRFWNAQDPIGRHVRLSKPDSEPYEIIGVAENSKNQDFVEDPMPYFYMPMELDDFSELAMVVKTAGDPSTVAGQVRRTLLNLNRDAPIIYFNTLRQHVRLALASQRMTAELIAALGGLGLLLAAVGLYGLTSFLVGRRTQEIGIRMALGARRASILRLVMGRTLLLTSVGLAIGLAAAVAASGALRAFLFGVAPHDVLVFTAAIAVLGLAACAAALAPALRAMKVDPMVALRYE